MLLPSDENNPGDHVVGQLGPGGISASCYGPNDQEARPTKPPPQMKTTPPTATGNRRTDLTEQVIRAFIQLPPQRKKDGFRIRLLSFSTRSSPLSQLHSLLGSFRFQARPSRARVRMTQ